ncbi:hypothetical protein T492DRAFT_923565 [Pavlovales sp. CCMP2436]|nr:hypothetical protein T492DRAFT_923565 [Pavlovales sp. CCMP2436]
MTLGGGAHACIQSINVFFGSVHISSIDEYGALFALTQDFTTDLDSLRSSGTVRGVADFSPVAVATSANIKDAYYARSGATIAAGGSLMVALPLMSVLGTLAMKAIPLSHLQDSIKLEVKWAVQTNWGTYVRTFGSFRVHDQRHQTPHQPGSPRWRRGARDDGQPRRDRSLPHSGLLPLPVHRCPERRLHLHADLHPREPGL